MKKLLSFSLAIFFIACEKQDASLDGNPIDSKITIETREVLQPASRRISFFCKTEKIYTCINFPILTEKEQDENSVKITFTSVEQTNLCLTATGPATVWVDADVLANGEYAIELNNANLTNKGTLKVTDTEIQLLFSQQRGIEIVRSTTKRVPARTYWGVIGYHDASSSQFVDEFIQKFKDLGAKFDKQAPGHYYYYEIDNSGERVYDTSTSGYWFARPLIFQFEGDESELKDFVRTEGKAYKAELSINIENYKGEQLNNWSN